MSLEKKLNLLMSNSKIECLTSDSDYIRKTKLYLEENSDWYMQYVRIRRRETNAER